MPLKLNTDCSTVKVMLYALRRPKIGVFALHKDFSRKRKFERSALTVNVRPSVRHYRDRYTEGIVGDRKASKLRRIELQRTDTLIIHCTQIAFILNRIDALISKGIGSAVATHRVSDKRALFLLLQKCHTTATYITVLPSQ